VANNPVLPAKGALTGEVNETQDTVRLMAGAIQEMTYKFEDRMSIWNQQLPGGGSESRSDDSIEERLNITSWWDEPCEQSHARTETGHSFASDRKMDNPNLRRRGTLEGILLTYMLC